MNVGGILFIEPHRVAPDVGLDSGGKPVTLEAHQQVALNVLANPVQVTPRVEEGSCFCSQVSRRMRAKGRSTPRVC